MSRKLCMLIYDIPTALLPQVGDPCPILRQLGFRINASCWVMYDDVFPHDLFVHMRDNGANPFRVYFDASEHGRLLERAAAALSTEIRAIVQSVRDSLNRAATNMERSRDIEQEKTFKKQMGQIISTQSRKLREIRKAVEVFGFKPDQVGDIGREREILTLRDAALDRSRRFVTEMNRLRREHGDGHPMIASVRQGGMPRDIFADWVDEQNGDGDAFR